MIEVTALCLYIVGSLCFVGGSVMLLGQKIGWW